ncbi:MULTISPECIES: nuclear transport factor 2 family protein [unclassified Acidovorax]|uniref:nuclear transport factor 2 family protein n=1 Tax=unclassified Acidovorax TaxID=2684926 RepID=UPI0028833E14|nr:MULTISPECIES: nuclear transport factor 2 family protein [unclassified Acidovorax]
MPDKAASLANAADPAARLRLLEAERNCRDLVLRSAALVDAGDAFGVAALFAEDAELMRPSGLVIRGRPAIERSYRERSAGHMTAHLVFGTLFGDMSDDVAHAVSRVLVWTANDDSEAGPQGRPAQPRQRLGHFVDTFTLTSQGWRISHRRAGFELFRD